MLGSFYTCYFYCLQQLYILSITLFILLIKKRKKMRLRRCRQLPSVRMTRKLDSESNPGPTPKPTLFHCALQASLTAPHVPAILDKRSFNRVNILSSQQGTDAVVSERDIWSLSPVPGPELLNEF